MLSLSSRLAKRRWAPLPLGTRRNSSECHPSFDAAASCTTPPTLAVSVTEFGVPSSEFTAAAGTTCSTTFGGGNGVFASGPLTAAAFASFPVTVGFTPTAVGERSAALTIADGANSASGTAALAGVGQGPTGNVDPGVSTAYTTGFTDPTDVVRMPPATCLWPTPARARSPSSPLDRRRPACGRHRICRS